MNKKDNVTKNKTDMKKDNKNLKIVVRNYLKGKVSSFEMNVEYFIYLLIKEGKEDIIELLLKSKMDDTKTKEVVKSFLENRAVLRKKIFTVADICQIREQDERLCFVDQVLDSEKFFVPIDKQTEQKLEKYVHEVDAGMTIEEALKKLKLNIDMLDFIVLSETDDIGD